MKRLLSGLAGCAVLAAPAWSSGPQWGAALQLSSDYLQRGVSRSNNDPALALEAHAQFSQGWFGSVWASTSRVREADSTTLELAATIGLGVPLSDDWVLRASVSHYESPWQELSGFYRYNELTLDLVFREVLLLSASWSPDTSRYSSVYGPVWKGNAAAYEAGLQHAVLPGLRILGGIGYYDLSDLFGSGYWYGSAGLAWSRGRWELGASYVIPGRAARRLSYDYAADRRAVATLRLTF